MNKISNAKLKFLLENMHVMDALNSIDIEQIEDHTVKVICRTIATSNEALNDLLIIKPNQQSI